MIKKLFTLFILCILFSPLYGQSFTENFDNITTLPGSGWYQQNNSSPQGTNPVWFQGNPPSTGGPFIAYNGADNAYIACNFNSTAGGTGTISNWLVAPNRTFRNGDVITFYTRKYDIGQDYPDRMEVRLSTNGASTNVGASATAVGDFTTLLLAINPTLVVGGYPRQWTQYTITISGLPAPTSGRIAFRYFVTNAGPTGTNSDYIGLDNVVYTPYVCPAFTMTPSGALTGGIAGNSYSYILTQTGALGAPNFAITSGALPPGLTLAANGTISGTPTATGTFYFTATVNDSSGCSASSDYSITIACPNSPITFTPAPQLCSNDEPITLNQGSPAGGNYFGTGVSDGQFDPSAGTQTISYTYTSPYGCFYTSTYTITVNNAPTVTPTEGNLTNGYVGTPYSTTFGQTGGGGTPSFTISSGSLPNGMNLSTAGVLSGTPSQYGTFTFTVSVTDGNSCIGTKEYILIIEDCPLPSTGISDFFAQCSVVLSDLIVPIMEDNCGNSITPTTNATFPITIQGTTVITWNYIEASGNLVTKNQNIIIDDTTAPVPTVDNLPNIIAQCQVSAADVPIPTATDNCGGSVSVSHNASFPITTQGTTVITWTYEDVNGNSVTRTQNIIIDDTTAPVPTVDNLPNIIAQCQVSAADVPIPTATDNCGGSVSVSHNASFPITTQGTTVITWTYEDVNGNSVTRTQNIIIDDTTAPVPTVDNLPNITAQCQISAADVPIPTATDNCSGSVSVSHNASFPITTQGTTVITWTYEDENGNSVTRTQNIIIDDTTAPVPTVDNLPNITAQCQVSAADVPTPTATDNCGGSVSVSHNASFPITTQGTTVITWTYEDENGNSVTRTQNIIIDDTTAPVPTVDNLPNITAQCQVSAADVPTPTATDNCGGSVSVSHNASFPITTQGTTVITWTYEDENGNSVTRTQNIIIDDTTAPVPTVDNLPNITAQCQVSATDVPTPTATDNCGGSVSVSHNASFPITTQGTTVITWTYEDENGNITTQTQNIVIDDTENPTITTQNLTLNIESDGTVSIDETIFDNWVSDNCGIDTISISQLVFDCEDLGEKSVTITVVDINGNETQENFTVTVNDPDQYCEEMSIIDTTKSEFAVYPNPAKNKVFVKPSSNVSIQKISIYSLYGQKIQENSFDGYKNEYEINVNYLEAGTYIIHIESSAGIYTKKLLIKG